MHKHLLLALLIAYLGQLPAQDLSGDWVGELWQTGATDTFIYQVSLIQEDDAVSGTATSTSADGSMSAIFRLSGRWVEGRLQLQEVQQIEPTDLQWCLKYMQMDLQGNTLSGDWTARACQPGGIRLRRPGTRTEELPFSFPGRWTGHLSQSDREYGFFYEINFEADGTGTSRIVSEGAGGEATHRLLWEENAGVISCQEPAVLERTDPNWKWCLKSLTFEKEREGDAYELRGDWEGHIEDADPGSGACAPGSVYLSKPVVTRVVEEEIAPQRDIYQEESGRTVTIDKVLQVRSTSIRLKVWDNGIVDGDILTLFLNGQRILTDHRVGKRKWSFPVEVLPGENLMILHAEDLGDIMPNTCAVAIDDGVEEQVIILSSNLRESGAILIQAFEVD